MDTLEFLQRVLPLSGVYVSVVINQGAPRQGFHQTVEELAHAVTALDKGGNNTYFAVNAFIEKGNRKQINVRACKSVYLDIDCGPDKPYADFKEGLYALADFVKKAGIPKPLIIFSGRGLHAYWPFITELPVAEWQPIADALKSAVAAYGLQADPVVTADSARILRPVGTHNPKSGLEVRRLIDAPDVNPADLYMALTGTAPAPVAAPPKPKRVTTLLDNLKTTPDYPKAVGSAVAEKCKQIAWMVEHQKDVNEPQWYALIGVAAHTTEPELNAVSWSNQHPQFNHAKTVSKLRQWEEKTTGPTTCTKFEELRPGGCKGCIFKDKVNTPARLSVKFEEVERPIDETVFASYAIPPLPYPFKWTVDGMKILMNDTDVDVCRFNVYPVSYGYDESLGYEVVRYNWDRSHVGTTELIMRQAYLADGSREFAAAIADQGIVLQTKKQTEHFQMLLRSYMDELRRSKTMTNLYSTMGWKEGHTQFLLGSTLLKTDLMGGVIAEPVVMANSSKAIGVGLYEKKGSLANWKAATRLLSAAGMHVTQYMLGVSFASILVDIMGYKSIPYCIYGQTGTGKTLTQYFMQSVWGDPLLLHYGASYTTNALFSHLALHNSLPCTIDEATVIPDKEVPNVLYLVTQNQEKARLDRNSVQRVPKTWANTTTFSTNRSMSSALVSSGYAGEALMARLIELTMPRNAMLAKNSEFGRVMFKAISENHGWAGAAFVEHIMAIGIPKIRERINNAIKSFAARYGVQFSGEERYWEAGTVTVDVALQIAHELKLIDFSPEECIKEALKQQGITRKVIVESHYDAFDLIAEYMNDLAGAVATVHHTANMSPMFDDRLPMRGEIRARYDVYRAGPLDKYSSGTLMLDRRAFRQWLAARIGDWKSFTSELESENVMATPKSQKGCLGKDTPFKLGQTYVIVVNLNHPRLSNALNDADNAIDNLTLGQLQAVPSGS